MAQSMMNAMKPAPGGARGTPPVDCRAGRKRGPSESRHQRRKPMWRIAKVSPAGAAAQHLLMCGYEWVIEAYGCNRAALAGLETLSTGHEAG